MHQSIRYSESLLYRHSLSRLGLLEHSIYATVTMIESDRTAGGELDIYNAPQLVEHAWTMAMAHIISYGVMSSLVLSL